MRLVAFTVKNYRSITEAYKLAIDDFTVIIGPNNEGKSNILRALQTGLGLLVDIPERLKFGLVVATGEFRLPLPGQLHRKYNWCDDFPVGLQAKSPAGTSMLSYEFALTPTEVSTFRDEVGSALDGTLCIEIHLGANGLSLRVRKKGPGAKTLTKKVAAIAKFLAAHLDYEYIPAVRTAEAAEAIVEQMVGRALTPLDENPEYKKALAQIAKLQEPALQQLSETVRDTLKMFLPGVRDVKVQVTERERSVAMRRACHILVDDGNPTLLRQKGDGVQSLAALGLIRKSSESVAGSRQIVLAIEEPESHLHPKAIHELRRVLLELAQKHQLVVTTHCPLLVNRVKVSANVIVEGGRASPAKSIKQIRQLLGVRASDNLQHPVLVLVVEGEDDRKAMTSLLANADLELKASLDDGTLAIDSLGGSGNLPYKLGQLRDALCGVHVWMDADTAGKKALEDCTTQGLLTNKDSHIASVAGKFESEMEDFYATELYESFLQNDYGVSTAHPSFAGNKKWSDRMRLVFDRTGKHWTGTTADKIKSRIAELAAASPIKALEPGRSGPIVALTAALKARLAAAAS